MKKEAKTLTVSLNEYSGRLGKIDSINLVVTKHAFNIHLCGTRECDTIEVPFEKYECYFN